MTVFSIVASVFWVQVAGNDQAEDLTLRNIVSLGCNGDHFRLVLAVNAKTLMARNAFLIVMWINFK